MAKPRLSDSCVSYFDECCKLYSYTAGGFAPQLGYYNLPAVKLRMNEVISSYSEYVEMSQNGEKKLPEFQTENYRKGPEKPLSVNTGRKKRDSGRKKLVPHQKLLTNPKSEKKFTSPTHFVCIKITDPDIHKALDSVQRGVVDKCPQVEPALTKLPLLHLTLMVIHLQPDELPKAIEALDQVKHAVNSSFREVFGGSGRPSFSMKGLDHFDGQVLFAKVDKGRNLVVEIGNVVRSIFESHGFYNTDDYPVNPHGTLMKLFQAKWLRQQGIRWLKTDWFRDNQTSYFGKQAIEGLQLCSMDKWRDPVNQFYRIEHSIVLE